MSTVTPLVSHFLCLVAVALLSLDVQAVKKDLPNLVVEDCFRWYSENIAATVRVYTPEKQVIPSTPSSTTHLTFDSDKPLDVRTDCNEKSPTRSLSLSFKGDDGAKLDLSLVIQIRDKRYWHLVDNETVITVTAPKLGNKDFKLRKSEVTAGDVFSFSCSRLELMSRRPTVEKPYSLSLVISRFQLQPFNQTKNSNRVFEDSFDCATWFTIPVWTGFLVILFFTAILSFGIFALLEIKTPDRFENPKGKTITVSATD